MSRKIRINIWELIANDPRPNIIFKGLGMRGDITHDEADLIFRKIRAGKFKIIKGKQKYRKSQNIRKIKEVINLHSGPKFIPQDGYVITTVRKDEKGTYDGIAYADTEEKARKIAITQIVNAGATKARIYKKIGIYEK